MSGFVYALERYVDVKEEASALLVAHYLEVAADRVLIVLNPDHARYESYDDAGTLHLVTCRCDGQLIGYYVCFVYTHPHYMDSLTAYTDVFFIRKDFRKGRVGINLFKFVEKTLRDRGVQRIYAGTKLSHDVGPILEHLDFKPIERIYTKVLR